MARTTYFVRAGDTLSRIAAFHGLSLSELLAVNPQITDPDDIVPDQQLQIPEEAAAPVSPHAVEALGTELPWLELAQREMQTGVKEIRGGENPRIIEYHSTTTGKAKTDEVAWCSSFVNWCMTQIGIKGTNSAWAQDWKNWGIKLDRPRRGCLVVFRWNDGTGHVGFFMGPSLGGVMVLGGNQSNAITIQSFKTGNIIAYRWPPQTPVSPAPPLPGEKPQGPAGLLKDYQQLFDACQIRADKLSAVDAIVADITSQTKRYQAVGVPLGIPWYFIAAIHSLESSLNFKTHLHNGDPLTGRTEHVPKGRPPGEPPFTWEESAKDAMVYKELNRFRSWTVPELLFRLEAYNGWGYRKHGINSPYLWSYSNHYSRGKYVRDGVWDPEAVSKQVGAAVLLKRLAERQVIKLPEAGPIIVPPPPGEQPPGPGPEPGAGPLIRYSDKVKSESAKKLQRFLNTYVDAELEEDGYPGDATSDAFYRVTGYWLPGDPREEDPVITYSVEEASDAAEDLQKWLNTFPGIDIEVDGYPGEETSDAFKKVTGNYLYNDPREDEEEV